MALSRGPERQLIDPKKTLNDLVDAVRSKNVDAVRELLNKHDKGEIFELVDDFHGRTVLHVAAAVGNLDILTLLLDAAPPNTVNMRDNDGETVLHKAVREGNLDILTLLLDAAPRNTVDMRDNDGDTVLHYAAIKGNLDIFTLLLDAAPPNTVDMRDDDGKTVLHYAASKGNVDILTLLLDAAPPNTVDMRDYCGETALYRAVFKGHADICRQLIKAGADVNQKLNDRLGSLLHMAIKREHTELVSVLLSYNANLYKQDENGDTPVHLAAGTGNVKISRSVLWHELFYYDFNYFNVKNYKSHMPLHVAVSACNVESVQRILQVYKFDNAWEDFIAKRSVLPEKGCVMDMAIDSGNEEISALLINHCHWESFLLVEYKNDKKQRCTPMRKLIQSMPHLASIVMNKCWTRNEEKQTITAHYQLVDDTFCSWNPNKQNTLSANNENTSYDKCEPYSEDKSLLKNNHPLQMIADPQADTQAATQLMDNPLVQSLLRRKWKLAAVVYFSFLLYYLTYLALITTLMFKSTPPFGQQTCENMSSSDRIEVPFANMALRGAVYVFAVFGMVLEITQFVLVKYKRYIAFHNIADWFSYVCPFVVFGTSSICGERTDWQWQLGVACLFVSYINILFYLRIVPMLGIYIMMVTQMLWNLKRFFVIMFLFLLSFGICFNLLLQNQVSFTNVGFSVIKNYNMMLGDIDFAGIFLDQLESDDDDDALHYAVMVWFLYVAFLVLMVLVMMNLLTSLAVSGVASLEKDSKHKILSQQITLSLDVEIALPTFLRTLFQGTIFEGVVRTETFPIQAQNNNLCVERLIGCMESFYYGNLSKKAIIEQALKNVRTASVAAYKPQAPKPLTIKDVDNCIEQQTSPLIKKVNDIEKSTRERNDNINKTLDLLTKRVDSIDMKLEKITDLLTKI